MRKNSVCRSLLGSTILTGVAAVFASPAAAADSADVALIQDAGDIAAEEGDRIVVTGSRIRRDEFTSISPMQTIDATEARSLGFYDIGQLIQQSPTVSGVQFDGSVNAGSPTAAVEGISEGGVGSNNIALRGLPASSTLLLVNGRRLGRSGVRGAPIAPDLNLLPSAIVERVEILTDGQSSIYGSDAVAGVVNMILRNDFEGLEINTNMSFPFKDGGRVSTVNFIAGASSDRGNITVAGEFYDRDTVRAGDRSETGCLQDIEVGTDGEIYAVCLDGRPDNAVFVSGVGFVYNTPGMSNSAYPNFSTSAGTPLGNAAQDPTYNLQDEEAATQLLEGLERYNLYATGNYDVDIFSRDTVYFEASYATRNSTGIFTDEQVFPGVPAMIPQEDANGNIIVDGMGVPILVDNPISPFDDADALPVYSLQALQQRRFSDVSNFRFVAGMEGDIPIGWFEENNWSYDIYGSYDRSYGVAHQPVLDEFAIRESLDTLRINSDGDLVCGLPRTATSFGFLTPLDCVVVDWFAPSLFTTQGGNKTFATQAETDFVSGTSINTTELETRIFNAIITGDLFELPGGTVGVAFGGEIREESISTSNDLIRTKGLAASEIPDTEGNTNGTNSIWGIFGEVELPVIEQITLNFAGRYSDDKFAGDNFSYSLKGSFQPTDWLRGTVTYGTTFRAPDLRALFLAGTTGTIGGGNDPCVVPTVAQDAMNNYLPGMDPRPQIVLDNCFADGADPTQLGLLAVTGITTTTGGNTALRPETSTSFTAGLVFSPQFSDSFDFDFSVTYFDIDVEDQILATSAETVLTSCYNDEPNLASALCDFVTRNTGDPTTATIQNVDVPFLNVGTNTSTGLDFNARFGMDLDGIVEGATFGYNLSATHYLEQLVQIDEDSPIDDNVGELGNGAWSALGTANIGLNNWSFLWRTRYIDSFQQDDTDALTQPADQSTTGSACGILGATVACADKDFGGSRFYNDFSLTYNQDSWAITAGINNVFDTRPPLIDQGEGSSRMNIVVQSGHDLIGRRAFVNLTKRF